MDASPASPQPFPASQPRVAGPGPSTGTRRVQWHIRGSAAGPLLPTPQRSVGIRVAHATSRPAAACRDLPTQRPAASAAPSPPRRGHPNPTAPWWSDPHGQLVLGAWAHSTRPGRCTGTGRAGERARGVAQARREEGSVAGTRAQAGPCAPRGALLRSAPKVPRSPLCPGMGTATTSRQPGRGGRGQDGQGVGGSARCRRGQRLRPALTQQGWGLAPAWDWDWGGRPGCRALQGPVPRASSGPMALPRRTMGQRGGLSHSPTRGHRPSVGWAP